MAREKYYWDDDNQTYYTIDKKGKRHERTRGDVINGSFCGAAAWILKVIIILYWGTCFAGGLVYIFAHAP